MSQQLTPTQPVVSPDQVQEGVRSLQERGFYIIERSLTEEQAAEKSQIMDDVIASEDSRSGKMGDFGYHIGQPCAADTRLCDMYANPLAIAIAEAIFGAEARLKDSGARISDRSSAPRITWHTHPYTTAEEPIAENPLRQGKPITRLLYGWYMDGCSPESGPLIVLPRRYDDTVNRALGGPHEAWPGEIIVSCPPGSCVMFTTDLWHSAMAGTSERRRHLCGGHLQSVLDTRSHREDGVFEGPAVEEAVQRNPEFARLLGR
jgi:hypothetical protein